MSITWKGLSKLIEKDKKNFRLNEHSIVQRC